MRILWASHVYPRAREDVFGAFLHRMAREIVSKGHEVRVVAPWDEGAPQEESMDGVQLERFRYPGDRSRPLAYSGEMHRRAIQAPASMVRFVAAMSSAVDRAVAQWKPELLHAHWWVPTALAVRFVRADAGPRVVSLHGTDVRLMRSVPLIRPLASWVLRPVDAVLPVSRALADELSPGIRRRVPEVLPMPADGDVFRVASPESQVADRRGFVVAARLTEQKRVGDALRALALARKSDASVRLTIAGDGPEMGNLRALAVDLRLEGAVDFRGMVSPPDLADLFRSATGVILPSIREGYGLTVVEAALCGAPAIGTRSGGLTDLISHGENGLLVSPCEPKELAAAMLQLAGDGPLVNALGEKARRLAQERTAGPLGIRLCAVYRELIERNG
ncbi:MAG: hypothetical protein DHS20C21_02260 [Gemmatimonadota bacterium]|nr:MAG: hypothetical protein DHS20C21_02260 [Gemmatimonadota bacterium]